MPVACWNETEKALRNDLRRPSLVRGLTVLAQECPNCLPAWLRLSPHNLCRTARRLGQFSAERARGILEKARRHPIWGEMADPHKIRHWTPLRAPEWLGDGLSPQELAAEVLKRQPLMRLDLLYRLLKS